MRSYRLKEGDTLRAIARSTYYVYDDQGNEDEERVLTVVREIIKSNPCVPKHFGFADTSIDLNSKSVRDVWEKPRQEGAQQQSPRQRQLPQSADKQHPQQEWIDLPDVPGISVYGTDWRRKRGRLWLYLLIWLAGIVLGEGFLLVQSYLSGAAESEMLFNWLSFQLHNAIIAPLPMANDLLPWLCIWSVAVWAAWLAFRPAVASPIRRARYRFLIGWLLGLIVLIAGSGRFIAIFIPRAAPTLTAFTDLFPLLIIWSILVFLLYLHLSDGSVLHAEYLVPHRGVWTVLALILMSTILAGFVGYQQVSSRIRGELSTLTLAHATLQQLQASSRGLRDDVNEVILVARSLDGEQSRYLTEKWPQLRREAMSAATQSQDAQRYVQAAIAHYQHDRSFLAQTGRDTGQLPGLRATTLLVTPAVTDTQGITSTAGPGVDIDYIQQQIDALGQISTVLTATIQATGELPQELDEIERASAPPDSSGTLSSTQQAALESTMRRLAEDAAVKADVATSAMEGIIFDGLPIFLWNGLFYAVLVLFPWLLLLLFLYRKRKNLAAQIYADLYRLDPNKGLLKRVLDGSNTRQEQAQVQKLLHSNSAREPATEGQLAAPHSAGQGTIALTQSWWYWLLRGVHPSVSTGRGSVSPAQPPTGKQKRAASETAPSMSDSGGDTTTTTQLGDEEANEISEIIDLLAKQTFSEFEYIISLIFLTLLLAVGWYYLLYPQTIVGLSYLIERGAGVRQLLGFITVNLTPLTISFAGAYFFLMQMLVRRYLSNDLYPTAFLQATQRLLIVFLLSLALTIIPLPFDGEPNLFARNVPIFSVAALVAGFLVGIFPTSGLQMIITTFNRWRRRKVFPETLVPEPLTKLPGVTIWVEARLLEENIESIQAMATAPIEQLIVATHYPTSQIVDWIDQAILYLHAGHDGEWFAQLRAIGIRGASDLLDAAGFNLLNPYASLQIGSDCRTRYEFDPDPSETQRLADAITEANASGVPRPSADDPRGIAGIAITRLLEEADRANLLAAEAGTLIQAIDPANQDTFDYLRKVRTSLDQAKTTLPGPAAVDALARELEVLGDDQERNRLLAATRAVKDDLAKAIPMLTALGSQFQSQVSAGVAQETLEQARRQFAEWQCCLADMLLALEEIAAAGTPAQDVAPAPPSPAWVTRAGDLHTALQRADEWVRTADQQVQTFEPQRPETFDARRKLMHDTELLMKSQKALTDFFTAMREIIESDQISKTPAQIQEITDALEKAEPAFKTLEQAARDARDYARRIQPTPTMAAAQASVPQAKAVQVGQAFAAAQDKAQMISRAVRAITQPPQLTPEILRVICDTIWPDPNITYILNFYQQAIDDLGRRPRKSMPA